MNEYYLFKRIKELLILEDRDSKHIYDIMLDYIRLEDMLDYIELTYPILNHDEFKKRLFFRHHGDESVVEHSIKVSYKAYRLALKIGEDRKSAAIAGLLHDLYDTPWQECREKHKFFEQHAFVHSKIALANSKKYFQKYLNEKIEDSIVKHMFPLTIRLPRYKISWLVMMSDKYVSLVILKDLKRWPSYLGLKKVDG